MQLTAEFFADHIASIANEADDEKQCTDHDIILTIMYNNNEYIKMASIFDKPFSILNKTISLYGFPTEDEIQNNEVGLFYNDIYLSPMHYLNYYGITNNATLILKNIEDTSNWDKQKNSKRLYVPALELCVEYTLEDTLSDCFKRIIQTAYKSGMLSKLHLILNKDLYVVYMKLKHICVENRGEEKKDCGRSVLIPYEYVFPGNNIDLKLGFVPTSSVIVFKFK